MQHVFSDQRRRIGWLAVLALAAWCALWPAGAAQAHAILVRSDPAAGSLLTQAPGLVRLTFSEQINPTLSRAVVLNALHTQQQINPAPSRAVSALEVDVPLPPKLGPGTYLVVWRSVSTDDGHILEDAFCFAVAQADGSRPASGPCTVPAGSVPGLGATSTTGLSPAALLSALGTWLALLGALAWVGGLLWQLGVLRLGTGLPATAQDARGLTRAARRGAILRFEGYLGWLIGAVLVGNLLLLTGNALQAGAGLGDGVRALLATQFGTFWLLRQIAALAGALVLVLVPFVGLPAVEVAAPIPAPRAPKKGTPPKPGALAMTTAQGNTVTATGGAALTAAPAAERRGLWRDGMALGAGVLVLIATALSGHAASVTGPLAGVAVPVDVLHLLATSAWVGGLWYTAAILLPTLAATTAQEQGTVLTRLLPLFSPVAYVAVFVLALTGSFNTDVHLTSLSQFVTTSYGLALFVKLLLVAGMIGISAWHVFRLRPRLAAALARSAQGTARVIPTQVRHLTTLLRTEAALGVGVVLCVALMSVLAGSLGAAPSSAGGQPVVLHATTTDGMNLTFALASTKVGGNAATLTVRDGAGNPVTDATVAINGTMLEMPMTTQAALSYAPSDQDYAGTVSLLMPGHWSLAISITTTANGAAHIDHATVTVVTTA